jgi:hypothetical protein
MLVCHMKQQMLDVLDFFFPFLHTIEKKKGTQYFCDNVRSQIEVHVFYERLYGL